MMNQGGGDIQRRVEAVKQRVDIAALIGAVVRLSRGSKPRGKCPFHGSKSDSLAVYPDKGTWKCWGCPSGGDALAFVQDFYGLDFMGALVRLEGHHGIDPELAEPVRREKVRPRFVGRETVDSAVVARHLWGLARPDPERLRVWLRARRVPEAMLDEHWLGQLRFAAEAPIAPWPVGGKPGDVAQAPAMVGLIRRVRDEAGQRAFSAIGVHATYLSPGLRAKMNRTRSSGDKVPARKMYGGSQGGAVIIGVYRRDAPLFIGEGIETVLSGMALAGAGEEACGLAVLSLENLQGGTLMRRARGFPGGVLPLFDVRPDPERPGVVFAHDGPVTGLIDADMKPLRGRLLRQAQDERVYAGLPVQERPGGPVVWRAISTAERAEICAALFVRRWRDAGCRSVRAIRPAMGMDFNDAAAGRIGELA
jgi:DNA primase